MLPFEQHAVTLGIVILLTVVTPVQAADSHIEICYGFGCKRQATLVLGDAPAEMLGRLFQPAAANGAQERGQIARAIAYLERHVGRITGTDRDVGGNYDSERDYPRRYQLDCIDESRNTTTYLRYLDRLGLLRWHRPMARHYRSRFLVDGHWTAVIEETGSGRRFAVDSWYHDNGEPPEIQPLEDWLKRKRPPLAIPD